MGNSASEIISKASSSSIEDLQMVLNQDIELLQDPSFVYSPLKIGLRSDLDKYSIANQELKQEEDKSVLSTDDEQSLVISQGIMGGSKEKRELVLQNLTIKIAKNKVPDSVSAEFIKRLQAFYRVFEAVIRSNELRQKRASDQRDTLLSTSLPPTARTAIKFGLNTLLTLVECVAVINAEIFDMVVNDTSKILQELGPLSMLTGDVALISAFNDIAKFFYGVLAGNINKIEKPKQHRSLTPLIRLASATGNTELFVNVAARLFEIEYLSNEAIEEIWAALKDLNAIKAKNLIFKWNSVKKAESVKVNEEKTKVRMIESTSNNIFLDCSFLCSKFYFEVKVVKCQENCYFGVADPAFSSATAHFDSAFTASFKATSEVLVKDKTLGNFEPWKAGSRLGVFVDMPEKKLSFYHNGVKMKLADISFTSDILTLFISLNGPCEFEIENWASYSDEIKNLLGIEDFQPRLSNLIEVNFCDDYRLIKGVEFSLFMLEKLEELLKPFEYLFKTLYRFEKDRPFLGVHFSKNTVASLYFLEETLVTYLKSKQYDHVSLETPTKLLQVILKLLNFHLRIAKDLEDRTLDIELKQKIQKLTFSILTDFTESQLTNNAALVISTSFEVFYRNPKDKLSYLVNSLLRINSEENTSEILSDMELKIYSEMARADKIFPAINLEQEEDERMLKDLYRLLIDLSEEASLELINLQQTKSSILLLFESVQSAFLAQCGKASFKGKWEELLIDYISSYFTACDRIISHITSQHTSVPENVLIAIQNSIVARPLQLLIDSLILSPLSLEILSAVLPRVKQMHENLANLEATVSELKASATTVETIYESPHNYPDSANMTHTVKIPGAQVYSLQFDPQCKTENNYDYLELWLDEAATNRFARWEGEGFPKEIVEVFNPILHFTFKSDGSNNFWGWKITIKSTVESSFLQKYWPDTLKDTIEHFIGICGSKMIDGSFVGEKSDEILKIMKNPLFKYGLADKSSILFKPLPPLNENLLKIISSLNLKPETELAGKDFEDSQNVSISQYISNYNSIMPQPEAANFLSTFIEGTQEISEPWDGLKKLSGVAETVSCIGGTDLDQAERAVFAVYIGFFEISETIKEVLLDTSKAGPTIMMMVKRSCKIRVWAQKHKKFLTDNGNSEITYKNIADDVVKKCYFLLGSSYKQSLKDIGINTVLKNLLSDIARTDKRELKDESKWNTLRSALKNIKKLAGLVSTKKAIPESANQDSKEFNRVAELVTSFLEQQVTLDKILESLQVARTRAICRATGFLIISKVLSKSTVLNTFIINTYIKELKKDSSKKHYSDDLEGIDPDLMKTVQESYFEVYKLLLRSLVKHRFKEFSKETYTHFLYVVEALSVPLHSSDIHMLADQPLVPAIKTILSWARGTIKEKPLVRNFLKENCITKLALVSHEGLGEGKTNIVLESKEDVPVLHLVLEKGGSEKPIVEFKLAAEESTIDGYEDAVGKFSFNGSEKWIYIKRADPSVSQKYLTGISNELVPSYSCYTQVLGAVSSFDRDKLNKLKQTLADKCWNLYKQIAFAVLGENQNSNSGQMITAQEGLLDVIFSELERSDDSSDLEPHKFAISALSTGEEWMKCCSFTYQRLSRFEAWLQGLFDSNLPRELENYVFKLIENLDPHMTGTGRLEDPLVKSKFQNLNEESSLDLISLFSQLKSAESLPGHLSNFFESNSALQEPPSDKYSSPLSSADLIAAAQSLIVPEGENSFKTILDLFIGTQGSVPKASVPDTIPAEFKDSSENLELFTTLNAIISNEKFAVYQQELFHFFKAFPELPPDSQGLKKLKSSNRAYISSLLWILFGAVTQYDLSSALASSQKLKTLLKFALNSDSIVLKTLSLKLLAKILPAQHSPESFSVIWTEFSSSTPSIQLDFCDFLLKNQGKSIFENEDYNIAYESRNFLTALLPSERWRPAVLSKLFENFDEIHQFLMEGKTLKVTHAGTIRFLSFAESFGVPPLELAVVGVKDSEVSQGIITSCTDGKTFSVYSIVDETSCSVDISKITNLLPSPILNLPTWFSEANTKIAEALVGVLLAFDQSRLAAPQPLEGGATLRTTYLSLESSALSGLENFLSFTELSEDSARNLISYLLKFSVGSDQVGKSSYLKCSSEIQKKIKEQLNKEDDLKLEEVHSKVEAFNEEDKTKFRDVIEKGVGEIWAYKCFLKGIKDFDGITTYVEPLSHKEIYKLSSLADGLSITDVHGTAEIYQNNSFQVIINDNFESFKKIAFSLPENLFHESSHFVDEITIRFALLGKGNSSFGFSAGPIVFTMNHKGLSVNNSEPWRVNNETVAIVRVNAKSSGNVKITLENTNECLEISNNFLFNGIQVDEFSLFLEKGHFAALLHLTVFEGQVNEKLQTKVVFSQKAETGERLVKVRTCPENIDKLRLKILGITEEQAQVCLNNTKSLHEAVKYSLQNFSPAINQSTFDIPKIYVAELGIYETLAEVPAGFKVVPVLEDLKPLDFSLPSSKVLAFKTQVFGKEPKGLVNIWVAENGGGESIGNLTIGEIERPNEIFIKTVVFGKNDVPIRDIILIKTSSLFNLQVPHGYNLIMDKDDRAINLAGKNEKYFVFMAVNKIVALLGGVYYPLEQIPVENSKYGLVDLLVPSPDHEDLDKYSSFSIMELYQSLYEFEKCLRSQLSKSLLESILSKKPVLIEGIIKDLPLKKAANLIPFNNFSTYLKSSSKLPESFLEETLALLLEYIIEKPGGRAMKPVFVESKHPYDNSCDIDDVISIPGAKGLKIEFSPQCYTEANCDPLKFYESPGRQGEIKVFSGQGESIWQSFEVPGSTVYTYFHSDGSVNYWGYEFTVTATNSGKGDSEQVSIEAIFDLLSAVIKSEKENEIVHSEKFLAPLYVFLQLSQSPDEKLKILEILKNLFRVKHTDLHMIVLNSFVKTSKELFNIVKSNRTAHKILQSLLNFILVAYQNGLVKIEEDWLLDLSDLFSDMQAINHKNDALDFFLFDIFRTKSKSLVEKEIESEHPYKLTTQSTPVQIKEAHSLLLEFSADSKSEDQHTAYISNDKQGEIDAEQDGGGALAVSWQQKGPDVVVDKDDKRVTRTNSNSWGNSFSNLMPTSGVFKINVFIENTGNDSEYLYIGFIEANDTNTYPLDSVTNNSYVQKVWTWKRSGVFHEKGSENGNQATFTNGDTLSFVVDLNSKTIICQKNSADVWKFINVSENLVLGASFGGSNQFIEIKDTEVSCGGKIEGKKVRLLGDSAFVWFPVYNSARLQYTWDFTPDDILALSPDKLIATSKSEKVEPARLSHQITVGRYYTQVKWLKGNCSFGIGPESEIKEKSVTENWLLSSSAGWQDGDLIGCLVDTQSKTVEFYKNSEKIESVEGKLQTGVYRFVAVFHEVDSSLMVVAGKPKNMNLLKFQSDGVSSEHGYKIKVIPTFKGRSSESTLTFLENCTEEFRKNWDSYKERFIPAFKSNSVEQLVTYIDRISASKSKDPLTMPVEEIEPTESELIYYPELEKWSKDDIKELFLIVQSFNKRVVEFLHLFDLTFTEHSTEMQKAFHGCRNLIFFSFKNSVLRKALDQTKSDITTEITIDRPKAAKRRNNKEVDTQAQFSITGQIFRAMSAVQNKGFRSAERIYKLNYKGEDSVDAAVAYNESMSFMCDELQSSYLRLLIPTSNHSNNIGENRESWTINPSARFSNDLQLFAFVGKLMGAAIRTQNCLALSLAPIIWKKLTQEPASIQDLREIDVCAAQIVEMLRDLEANNLTKENFHLAFDDNFVSKDSSGLDVELIPNGNDVAVTYDNCSEYVDLLLKMRLNESNKAVAKIREGISAVVQIDLLGLFSWQQLETLVCGEADVNVETLKENTDYENCGLSDQHIQFFWEVMGEYSKYERSLFLRFVSGRKRLPSGKDWKHMKVNRFVPAGPVDNYMPVSHTCSFTLDLPAYTVKDFLRQKLTYAITHFTATDLDGSPGAGLEDND